VDAAVAREANYFDLAIVDVLVKGRQDTPSKIW